VNGRDQVLPASFATDPDRLRRFEHGARAAASLNHPNIVAVYDVGTHEVSPYLVTEFLEGQTLRDKLLPRLSVERVPDYAAQIARGLAAAHAKGILHRDLKPENIFVAKDGCAGGEPRSFVGAVPAGWRCTGDREWIRRRGPSRTLERRRKVDLVGQPDEWCTANHAD
jgi:serine/threonine protein kinase